MEPRIQVMPPPLANQIAAGEVVERPASVVKELIENALDAGARRIEIEVSGGGMKRILVADDGAGIRPDDARLAFQRHATSKVHRAEDLAALATLGFRGEALPSIASVSRTTLVTRRRSSAKEHGGGGETGTKVVVEGGAEVEVREAPAPPGTAVEVRDLFFNTPARLKFLKSERTELSRTVEAASNAALAFPEVGFHLKTGKKVLLDLPPTDREGRVRALLPAREAEGLFSLPTLPPLPLLKCPTEARPVRVEGFASLPSVTRAGRSCQHVVINDRTVRDQTVVGAVYDVYRGLIPSGRHPLLFLYVTMDPADLDVNVHPAKAEVRFRDGRRVFSAVRRALGEGLVTASGVVGDIHASPAAGETEFPGPGGAGRPSVAKVYPLRRPGDRPDSGGSARPASWKFGFSGGRRAGGGGGGWGGRGRGPGGGPGAPAAHSARPAAEAFPDLSPGMDSPPPSPLPLLDTAAPKHLLSNVRVIGQLYGTFVLLEHPCGLLVMDQHTAHERVLFARLTEKADAGRVERQALLIPANVEVSAAEAPWVSERLDDLDRLGLRIEPFGPTTFIVREVPALLAHVDPSVLARAVLEALAGEATAGAGPRKKTFSDLAASLIDRMACRGAVKAHHRMSNEEIEHLVSECLELDILFTCPHGRPITLVLPKEEVERRFLRR